MIGHQPNNKQRTLNLSTLQLFFKEDIEEIINLQPKQDNKAKPYQVKQIRNIILKYNLNTEKDEV